MLNLVLKSHVDRACFHGEEAGAWESRKRKKEWSVRSTIERLRRLHKAVAVIRKFIECTTNFQCQTSSRSGGQWERHKDQLFKPSCHISEPAQLTIGNVKHWQQTGPTCYGALIKWGVAWWHSQDLLRNKESSCICQHYHLNHTYLQYVVVTAYHRSAYSVSWRFAVSTIQSNDELE